MCEYLVNMSKRSQNVVVYYGNFQVIPDGFFKRVGIKLEPQNRFRVLSQVEERTKKRMGEAVTKMIKYGDFRCLEIYKDYTKDEVPLSPKLTTMLLVELVQNKLPYFFRDMKKKEYSVFLERMRKVLSFVIADETRKVLKQ